ncbi:MAG TPA: hypothetical protein IGS40_14045 [Trichormus sp. M33_DOE_039]|nr:hypothetical protein [Trichormus sp. M33_DOE_039]
MRVGFCPGELHKAHFTVSSNFTQQGKDLSAPLNRVDGDRFAGLVA